MSDYDYEPCRSEDIPSGVRFDVPRALQGQTVEVEYGGFGHGEHAPGAPFKKVTDRSAPVGSDQVAPRIGAARARRAGASGRQSARARRGRGDPGARGRATDLDRTASAELGALPDDRRLRELIFCSIRDARSVLVSVALLDRQHEARDLAAHRRR